MLDQPLIPKFDRDQFIQGLPALLERMADGEAIMIHSEPETGLDAEVATFMNQAALKKMGEEGKWLFVSSLNNRPGADLFFATLEYEFFPPGTPLSHELAMIFIKWGTMIWLTARVPSVKEEVVVESAKWSHMRLVRDSSPRLLSVSKVDEFPLTTKHLLILENELDSPVYKGEKEAQQYREAMTARTNLLYGNTIRNDNRGN